MGFAYQNRGYPDMKSVAMINERILRGEATVLTAREFKERTADGEQIGIDEVDVVTTGTFGVMSGTFALLSFPVARPGSFDRAGEVWLNDVPAYPGPCPNEWLGIVDVIVYGTAHTTATYGGGHLFRDLVERKAVDVEVTVESRKYSTRITLDDCNMARLITTRSAYRNYTGYLNRGKRYARSIFSVTKMKGRCRECSVSGCGEINPLENDPKRRVITAGMQGMLNGAPGWVIGEGTRSSPERPNLSVFGDLKGMDPVMMGGFCTSNGPECLTSLAIPIPVLDESILDALRIRDADIVLPLADIADRVPISRSDYGKVWNDTDWVIQYSPTGCRNCEICTASRDCPTGAITPGIGIDRSRCVNCGTCVKVCPGGNYLGRLGSITVGDLRVPITLRQSDRNRAEDLCMRLKKDILAGKYQFTTREG
jgi:putative methanogenesis marker 16 metalloprotein